MGQYFIVANLDKREYLNNHLFDRGIKLGEVAFNQGAATALVLLLAGRWGGDRIVVCGDYGTGTPNVYARAHEEGWKELGINDVEPDCHGYHEHLVEDLGRRRLSEVIPPDVVAAFMRDRDDCPRSLRHAMERAIGRQTEGHKHLRIHSNGCPFCQREDYHRSDECKDEDRIGEQECDVCRRKSNAE